MIAIDHHALFALAATSRPSPGPPPLPNVLRPGHGRGGGDGLCQCQSSYSSVGGVASAPHASSLHPLSRITARADQGNLSIEDGKSSSSAISAPRASDVRTVTRTPAAPPPPHGPNRSRSQKRDCQFPAPARRSRLGRGLNRLSSVSTLTRADPLVDPGLRGRWETREGGLDG